NALVMKFDPDGALLWRAEYESDFDGSSTRKCLVDLANNIYVAGLGMGPNGLVTQVKKLGPDGTSLWTWFDPDGIGAPVNFKFTPDSSLVISARSITGILNGYARIDRDGNSLWSLAGLTSQTIGDAAGDADGNTYCVHGTQGGSVIRKLSPTGAELWQNTYAITAYRVEVASDGGPVVSGFPAGGGGGAAFLKADANGTQLWSNPDADGPNIFLLHAQMVLDEFDNAYLCAGTLFAMGICKVNSNGTGAWHITAGNGNAQGFALGNDYAVYVVGGSTLKLGQDITTEVHESIEHNGARAFPVPVTDNLSLEWVGHSMSNWRLLSLTGALLAEGRWTHAPIEVAALPPGVFVAVLIDATGELGMVRVMKE
ncbi:MAG TPA: hypothetical protein PKY96_07820, partial [Flavobacteriales bacterium]|nr:hypothetical protein [Flavobacteriales bacterium]